MENSTEQKISLKSSCIDARRGEWSPEFLQDMESLGELINSNDSFIVTTHVFPDGDAIGSQVALHEFLIGQGRRSVMINSSPTPEKYAFLDPENEILVTGRATPEPGSPIARALEEADAIIVVDCAFLKRTGAFFKSISKFRGPVVSIDHHEIRGSEPGVAISLVEHSAAACGEMVLELILHMGARPGQRGVDGIYTALVTDTARFTGSAVNDRVLGLAAKLVRWGAEPNYIYKQIYESYSLEHYRLFSKAMETMIVSEQDDFAVMVITRQMFSSFGVRAFEVDFFIDMICSIRGLRLIAVAREIQKELFAVSLRSRCELSVGRIAEEHGGGGHRDMAGMNLQGPASQVGEILATAFEQTLRPGAKPIAVTPMEC